MRDPMNSGPARWRIAVLMETVPESGKGKWSPVSKHQIQSGVGRTSGLTQDRTAEPNSRDQTLRREWVRENSVFSVQLFVERFKSGVQVISGEPKDWNSWSLVYQAQLSTTGYVDALKTEDG